MRPSSPPWITASAPSRSTSSVVALGADDEAVHRGERGEIDEVERPHDAARGREGGDHRQHVAGHRIAELVDACRAGRGRRSSRTAPAASRRRLSGIGSVGERMMSPSDSTQERPSVPSVASRSVVRSRRTTCVSPAPRTEKPLATGVSVARFCGSAIADRRCRTASRRCRRGGTPRRRRRARTGRPAAPCCRRR